MAPSKRRTVHAWTDGSYQKSAGLGWVITEDDQGGGSIIDQGSKTLTGKQVAFDAEITATPSCFPRDQRVAYQRRIFYFSSKNPQLHQFPVTV
jgi:hypothetical protein